MARPGDPSVVAGPGLAALPVLHGRRLTLRAFRPEDVGALVALDADPEVRRFVEDGRPSTRGRALEMMRHWHEHANQHPGFGCWAADDRRTGDFVGWFHLFARGGGESERRCELGFRLARSAWGLGLGTEGSLALIDHAFGSTAATSVIGETMVIHVASRRVMEKCGMSLVATFRADWPVRIAGDEFGDVRYEITRDAWRAR